jgi:5'/3'-nucleotidase SurE
MLGSRFSRGLAAGALMLVLATPAAAVNILLSNDDGYNAPGIVALQAALEADGHTVTVVAPSGNRSGSSAALTLAPFAVEKIAENVYSVDATPASTVMFGAWLLTGENKPDLVVSGINFGANIGTATVISGTVGNVVAAIEEIDAPTPGIAFSTNPVDADPNSEANREHFKNVAAFAARLVRRLTRSGEVRGLRPGKGLNVNYPALPPAAVKGVVLAVQGLTPIFANEFVQIDEKTYAPALQGVDVQKDVADADTILFQKGYITIVPIDGDYTAPKPVQEKLEKYFQNLKP